MRFIDKADEILGINSLLTEAERAKAKPAPKPMPNKRQDEKPFIRVKYVPNKKTGRPYYYLVQNYTDDKGRRRQRVLEYLGTRKPRGYKPK